MALPLNQVPAGAAQAAQNLPGQQQQPKQVDSRFDEVMANKGEMNPMRVDPATRIDHASLHKLNDISRGPVLPSPETDMVHKLSHSVNSVENHWNSMNEMVKSLFTRKDLSTQDCLKMQAVIQKYSMELDLTGKVVEKATNGLKDTLKTQV